MTEDLEYYTFDSRRRIADQHKKIIKVMIIYVEKEYKNGDREKYILEYRKYLKNNLLEFIANNIGKVECINSK